MPKYGTFMQTEHFGSKFFCGKLVKHYKEPPLFYLQGKVKPFSWTKKIHTPISENVVGENGEWQLSDGNCTTERNCGFHINEFFAWR